MPAPARDRWLAEEWATAFGRSVDDMTGLHTTFDVLSVSDAPSDLTSKGSLIWKRQKLDLAPEGLLFIGAAPSVRSEIGTAILKAAGIDDGDAATIEGTFGEILGQAAGALIRIVSAAIGKEVKTEDSDAQPPEAPLAIFEVRIKIADASPGSVYVGVPPALTHAIEQGANRSNESPPAQPPPPEAPAEIEPGHKTKKMDLLLDVELPVSVSFGRAQLPLKDVIKLTTGSIIELNRSISEPVDVIVNNCVIARREIVVVEGNFGVRIQRVVSRQERLRTLQ